MKERCQAQSSDAEWYITAFQRNSLWLLRIFNSVLTPKMLLDIFLLQSTRLLESFLEPSLQRNGAEATMLSVLLLQRQNSLLKHVVVGYRPPAEGRLAYGDSILASYIR